ncbi:hypothetical protein SAMN05216268_101425 [Streptomyces yunnanensis]|uniref:Uncharacterized protein n=1 Tax=Streptomyces yunnanensis TaxID=156453 RepID=A0A9X8MJH8_9ACTN|nr:hypothetical protein SAMN05216268_101425 [Streptomyces yunnanensis]
MTPTAPTGHCPQPRHRRARPPDEADPAADQATLAATPGGIR